EPAAGTNPAEKRDLAALISKINTELGVSVLLIEHDMKLVMSIAHRLVVLNFGQKIAEGTPEEFQRDPAVIAAYLGSSEEEAADELAAGDLPAAGPSAIDIEGGLAALAEAEARAAEEEEA